MTGDRARTGAEKRERVGYEFAHSIVDDHSRLAYSSFTATSAPATVTGFVERALAFFEAHGIEPKRLMTDNHFAYTNNRALRELLRRTGSATCTIRPYRPQTNGKVERYQQTIKREWGSGSPTAHPSTARALPHWLATTTSADPTQRSGTGRRSAAFTTSRGRTPRARRSRRRGRSGG